MIEQVFLLVWSTISATFFGGMLFGSIHGNHDDFVGGCLLFGGLNFTIVGGIIMIKMFIG